MTPTPVPSLTPIPTPAPLQTLRAANAPQLRAYDSLIVSYPFRLVWSLDGSSLGILGREGAFLFNSQDWTRRAELISQKQEIFLDISPDGQTLALTLDQRSVELRNVSNGEKLKMLLPAWFFSSVFFSPDGQYLAMAQVENPAVDLWNIKTGEISQTVHGQPGALPWQASFPGPVGYLAWASGNSAQIIDLQTSLSTVMMHQDEAVGTLALSPDSRSLAAAGSLQLFLWDTNLGTIQARVPLPAPATALAFSPNGELLVVGAGGKLLVLESITWSQVAALDLPGGTVLSLAFAPDGRQFACGTSDGFVTLWGVR